MSLFDVYEYFCLQVCIYGQGSQKGASGDMNWSYRWFEPLCTSWGLNSNHLSGRADSALMHWASSPAPLLFISNKKNVYFIPGRVTENFGLGNVCASCGKA